MLSFVKLSLNLLKNFDFVELWKSIEFLKERMYYVVGLMRVSL